MGRFLERLIRRCWRGPWYARVFVLVLAVVTAEAALAVAMLCVPVLVYRSLWVVYRSIR